MYFNVSDHVTSEMQDEIVNKAVAPVYCSNTEPEIHIDPKNIMLHEESEGMTKIEIASFTVQTGSLSRVCFSNKSINTVQGENVHISHVHI